MKKTFKKICTMVQFNVLVVITEIINTTPISTPSRGIHWNWQWSFGGQMFHHSFIIVAWQAFISAQSCNGILRLGSITFSNVTSFSISPLKYLNVLLLLLPNKIWKKPYIARYVWIVRFLDQSKCLCVLKCQLRYWSWATSISSTFQRIRNTGSELLSWQFFNLSSAIGTQLQVRFNGMNWNHWKWTCGWNWLENKHYYLKYQLNQILHK